MLHQAIELDQNILIQVMQMHKEQLAVYQLSFLKVKSISKFIELSSVNFVVLQDHIENFSINKVIKSFFPEAKIVALPKVTEGAVITSMKGIEEINDELPIIFNDCDHLFKSEKFNTARIGIVNLNGTYLNNTKISIVHSIKSAASISSRCIGGILKMPVVKCKFDKTVP